MTVQELRVKSMLQAIHVPFDAQVSLPIGNSEIVVDFCIANRYILECSYSERKATGAMGMLRRSAAYIDWKARRIHHHYGSTYLVGAILEAPKVQRRYLEKAIRNIMEEVDFLFFDVESFGEFLVGLRPAEVSQSNSDSRQSCLDVWTNPITKAD